MKKRRNKCYLAAGALMAAGLMWLLPMKAEAKLCYEWKYNPEGSGYGCSTPMCHNGSELSYFHTISYKRECIGENGTYYEYDIKKENLGCCPHL